MKEMDPYRVPWFSDVAPSLLTNRTVRNYLNGFSEQSWPHVVKLTLLYGIVSLQQQYPGETFSLQQLKQAVQSAATNLVVQRNVPQLHRQLLNLQTDLDKVFDRLTVEVRHCPKCSSTGCGMHTADARSITDICRDPTELLLISSIRLCVACADSLLERLTRQHMQQTRDLQDQAQQLIQ